MTSAIASSTASAYTPPVAVVTQQVKAGGMDSDGDHDGTKVAAASGTVGTIINTTA